MKMDEALITLLEKKDFDYNTIKEICQVAGVNRPIFYLHYENTSDLLRETTRYIMEKHLSYYSAHTAGMSLELDTCPRGGADLRIGGISRPLSDLYQGEPTAVQGCNQAV